MIESVVKIGGIPMLIHQVSIDRSEMDRMTHVHLTLAFHDYEASVNLDSFMNGLRGIEPKKQGAAVAKLLDFSAVRKITLDEDPVQD
jgi:hypothetical protein